MARHEADREDLVKEATAYVVRGEFTIPDCEHPIFIGFRKSGAFSFYFGADPVYQFDPHGRLRRAFVAGRLYRSEGETLCSMQRHRSETESSLMRIDISPQQGEVFQWGMHEAIRQLQAAVDNGHYEIRTTVDTDELWIEKIKQGCELVLKSDQFLAPKLVERE